MEEYPEELRTSPPALIAVTGFPELHQTIATHLQSQQPPINTLPLPDFSEVSHFLPKKKSRAAKNSGNGPPPPPAKPGGILKRDWLLKHRTKLPSVTAAFFNSDQVSGDPTQWRQLCADLDCLKGVIRPRNIKLVLVVVRLSSKEDISEEQLLALRKRAEVESKYLFIINSFDPTELKRSLDGMANTFSDLAHTYYRDEGRRIKTRVEKKNFGFIELNIRYCIKVAVYAEFRCDWVEALRFYEDAYNILREMVKISTRLPAVQRLVEIKTVAEYLHFKISTLLLHGGKVSEAVTWFHQHNDSYKKVLGAPEAVFLHWEWMSRQFLVFAELLETSSVNPNQKISSLALGSADQPFTEWEFHPAYYYQLAAHYLMEKRSSLEDTLSMLENVNEIDSNGESVSPSIYIGQFCRLIEQEATLVMELLRDEEYTRYAISEGKRFHDSFEIIALLRKSRESYSNGRFQRASTFCGYQMAKEYFAVSDFKNAKEVFESVASLYRKEGWVIFLWEILGYLGECSKKRLLLKDYVKYSLEMAALPVFPGICNQSFIFKEYGPAGPPSFAQREAIHKEIFKFIGDGSESVSTEDENLIVTEKNPIHLEINPDNPLKLVLVASVAFHEVLIKPGMSTLFTMSFLSQLPLNLEIDQFEIQFNQSECNFTITNAQKSSSVAISDDQKGCREEITPSLTLFPGKWLRLTYKIKPEQSGKLDCISVTAKIGRYFQICCKAESPASMGDLPLWKFEDCVHVFPMKDPILSLTGQKGTEIDEPDTKVDVILGASGPAFVGESFMVPVTVVSKGPAIYSGELKINLVDVQGGGLFSPRATFKPAMDGHHVELRRITGPEGEDELQLGPDNIKKIQQSFGLISMPILKSEDTWSCKLEIKWYRPKPIMLFVSLGYGVNETDMQKVSVNKSLQIEGKTGIMISHQFMLPFRSDPLLLSRFKPFSDADQPPSLPLHETSVLVISSKNCAEVPLQLQSVSIEPDDEGFNELCNLGNRGKADLDSAVVMPREEHKKVFTVAPKVEFSNLSMGTVCLKWRRANRKEQPGAMETRYKLPNVAVEVPPLVVSLEWPPYVILGVPFTYFVKIQNNTRLLQEVKFSLVDSQSFVLSGTHNDTLFVLPKSQHILSYKILGITSGKQQLPKVSVTSERYSAAFQPSIGAHSIFVFPFKPQLKMPKD